LFLSEWLKLILICPKGDLYPAVNPTELKFNFTASSKVISLERLAKENFRSGNSFY
jgi:hypothetical protein